MGFLVLSPLLLQFVVSLYRSDSSGFVLNDLLTLVPLLSIEVILIYFFRIVLHHYKSVKTQIMQIELRQTLCQFIQSYADYSKKIKKDDPSALEKFENLIFSGILSESDKLPSTFDGIEQLGTIFKSVKN